MCMHGKALTTREANKILKDNGWKLERQTGGHLIYQNEEGDEITITSNRLSQKTWKRECKKHGIIY